MDLAEVKSTYLNTIIRHKTTSCTYIVTSAHNLGPWAKVRIEVGVQLTCQPFKPYGYPVTLDIDTLQNDYQIIAHIAQLEEPAQ